MSDNLTMAVMEIAKNTSGSNLQWWSIIPALVSPLFFIFLMYGSSIFQLPKSLWIHQKMKSMEKSGRHCMIMCHGNKMSLFNMSSSMITLSDSSAFIKAFNQPKWAKGTVELILNTPGGMVLAAEQIANVMKSYSGKINVYVSDFAMSGGTLIALAADNIYMAPNAVLGNLDPQLSAGLFDQYPCASIVAAAERPNEHRDDKTLILADVSRKAISQMTDYVFNLLSRRLPEPKARELAVDMTTGKYTHDYPIDFERAKSMGLWVSQDIPKDIKAIMDKLPSGSSSVKFKKVKDEKTSGIQISL